ncbi:hypothetical protein BDV93DRAFT_519106 [Ceratobasidium sp. AG-I]|nr:hypothetical protein BDV93DRAFT_519106 [Ceratobasidium sp. AG-I]
MARIEPGTYRIINVASETAITVPNYDHWAVVGWESTEEPNQHWFVQRSGEGFRFKNCFYGQYITLASTDWFSKVYLGRYPASWQILPSEAGSYVIQYGDADRVLDLHDAYGPGRDGNEIHIWPRHELQTQKRWKFERISDDTGDEDAQPQQVPEDQTGQIALKDEEIARQARLLAEKEEQLAQKDQQLVEQATQLAAQSQQVVEQSRELVDQGRRLVEQSRELAERSEKLAEKDEEMVRGYKELGDKLAWVAQRENVLRQEAEGSRLSEIEIQTVGSSVQEEDIRRDGEQSEVASLREKVERLERMMAQMMEWGERKPNNMA